MQSLQKLIPSASDELRGEFKVGPLGKTKSLGSLAFCWGGCFKHLLTLKKNYVQQKRLVETSQNVNFTFKN